MIPTAAPNEIRSYNRVENRITEEQSAAIHFKMPNVFERAWCLFFSRIQPCVGAIDHKVLFLISVVAHISSLLFTKFLKKRNTKLIKITSRASDVSFPAYNYTDVAFLSIASQCTKPTEQPYIRATSAPNDRQSQSPGVGRTELINYQIWPRILCC